MKTIIYDKKNQKFINTIIQSEIKKYLEKPEYLIWTDIYNPSAESIEILKTLYNFHPLAIEDSMSKIERPKIDEFNNYLFMILQIPIAEKDKRLKPGVVSIFTGFNYIVTVHDINFVPIKKIFNNYIRQEKIDARDSGALLHKIIDVLIDYCFPILDLMNSDIVRLENQILEVLDKISFKELIILRRNILMFRSIFRAQIIILKNLELKDLKFISDELEVFFGDIVDHAEKIWDLLSTYKDVIEGLYDTYQSLMSNKINDIMKILTIVSVIIMPMTLLSGIYGMNVLLPLQKNPDAFWIISIFMLILALFMMVYFRKKKWI